MSISDQTRASRARRSTSRSAGTRYRKMRTPTPDFLPKFTPPQAEREEARSHCLYEREDTPEPESFAERGQNGQTDSTSNLLSSPVITEGDIRIVTLDSIQCLRIEDGKTSSSGGALLPGEQFEEWVMHYLSLRENASTFSVFMAALKTHLMCLGQRPYVPLDRWFRLSPPERWEWIWIVRMAKVAFLYNMTDWRRDDPWLIGICLRTWKVRSLSSSAFVVPLVGNIGGVFLPPTEGMSASPLHQVTIQSNRTDHHREMIYKEHHYPNETLMACDR